MIKVEGVTKSFGATRVLDELQLRIAEGSVCGLIGPSGGGKSTLLKVLCGIYPPDSGRAEIDGKPIDGERSGIGLMFQEGALFDSLSVFDNVAFPLVNGRVPAVRLPAELRESVCEKVSVVLNRVGLAKAAHKLPGQLSGGMRRRASLARALVARPKILLLDDPTSGLDPVASSVIMELISEMCREYRPTAVIVSHDLRRLLPIVESVAALFHGKALFHGTIEELRAGGPEAVRQFVRCRFDLDQAA